MAKGGLELLDPPPTSGVLGFQAHVTTTVYTVLGLGLNPEPLIVDQHSTI